MPGFFERNASRVRIHKLLDSGFECFGRKIVKVLRRNGKTLVFADYPFQEDNSLVFTGYITEQDFLKFIADKYSVPAECLWVDDFSEKVILS